MGARVPVALTIAGSDPSGGAGIQADLKVFHQFGVYGEAAISLLTVQNTRGVMGVNVQPAGFVEDQIRSAVEDIPPTAAKTGALGSAENVTLLARLAAGWDFPLVCDPVMISTSGAALLPAEAVDVFRRELLPQAFLVTPNLDEAEVLTGLSVRDPNEMWAAARALRAAGSRNVLVKGGHLPGAAVDILLSGDERHTFEAPRLPSHHSHGSGCAYSAAITASLARGTELPEAVRAAKAYVYEAIRTHPGLGSGRGPLNYFAPRSS